MPVFRLHDELVFPPPDLADPDGLLAVGGDLSPERLILSYQNGIFPWYNEEEPPLWWCPDPRLVLFPGEIHIAKSMRPYLNQARYQVTCNRAFRTVMEHCSDTPREGQSGTWINQDVIEAYTRLHRMGLAHSVEVWEGSEMVGGLYGVSMGAAFFGESMFSHKSNASKTGFIRLVQALHRHGFTLIDCQVRTAHLVSLGAREISRREFLKRLQQALKLPGLSIPWTELLERGDQ